MAGPYHGSWASGVAGGFFAAASGFGQCFTQSALVSATLPTGPGPMDFSAGSDWTIELRVRTTQTSGNKVALGRTSSSLWIGAANGAANASIPGFTPDMVGPSISDGAWHTLAVCVSAGTTARFFVDGTLAVTRTGTFSATTAAPAIGSYGSNTTFMWNGDIDEVAFYSAALYSATYTPASVPVAANAANLVAVYHLDGDLLDGAGAPQMGTISVSSSAGLDTISYPAATAGTNPVAGYALYLGNAARSAGIVPIATAAGAGGGSFAHRTPPGATSYYWVRAYDNAGTAAYSAPSNEVSGATSSGVVIAPNNSALLYSPFNWTISASAARTISAGAYLRVLFTGTSVGLACTMGGLAAPFPKIVARIDGGAWTSYDIAANLMLATGLVDRTHLLEIALRSMQSTIQAWTPPQQAYLEISGLYLDATKTASAPPARPRTVLLYGDSISAGASTVMGASASTSVNDSDCTVAYSYAMGELLNVEVGVVAYGGHGWASGALDGVPNLATSYNQQWSGQARSFASPAPDVVLYFEGYNDGGASSATIQANAQAIIGAVLAAAPNSKHLVVPPYVNRASVSAALPAAVAALNSSAITLGSAPPFSAGTDSADGVHALAWAHLAKLGPSFVSQMRPLVNATGRRKVQ